MTTFACARCGVAQRAEDTFLCYDCLVSPTRRKEQAAAEATFPADHLEQRRLLTGSYSWAGWSRRLKGASRA